MLATAGCRYLLYSGQGEGSYAVHYCLGDDPAAERLQCCLWGWILAQSAPMVEPLPGDSLRHFSDLALHHSVHAPGTNLWGLPTWRTRLGLGGCLFSPSVASGWTFEIYQSTAFQFRPVWGLIRPDSVSLEEATQDCARLTWLVLPNWI